MTTTDHHPCSQTIFSGERWDFGGHPCSIKATVEGPDGRWWCKRHDPEAKAERAARRDMKEDERAAARDEAEATIRDLIARAGLDGATPTKPIWAKFGDPYTGAYVPIAALQALVDLLEKGIGRK